MGILDIFKKSLNRPDSSKSDRLYSTHFERLARTFNSGGVCIEFSTSLVTPDIDGLHALLESASAQDSILGSYLIQLVGEGRASLTSVAINIEWQRIYELLSSAEHLPSIEWLDIPKVKALQPILGSNGTLSDPSFSISISGWIDNSTEVQIDKQVGAVVFIDKNPSLLSQNAWLAYSEVEKFNSRSEADKSQHKQELAWGRIRAYADRAGALYENPYLGSTYVLTPEALRLPMSQEETKFGRVFTVNPTFDGAPSSWLATFDSYQAVQPYYEMTRGGGRVKVVISEPVRQVLEVIKKEMPARKVAGSRAQQFIHNPWAFLGEAANEVLDADQFENDRAEAGQNTSAFSLSAQTEGGRIEGVRLIVTIHHLDGASTSYSEIFRTPDDLERFLHALQISIEHESLWFAWKEFDLSLDGESLSQLDNGKQLYKLWCSQPALKVNLDDIYTLENYNDRILGIGAARPMYVPVLQVPKKEDAGSLTPDDLTPMVMVNLNGHEGQVLIPLTRDWVAEFEDKVILAEKQGWSEVSDPALPSEVSTTQARTLVDGFKAMLHSQDQIKLEISSGPKEKKSPKETLLVKSNFNTVDYKEIRRAVLRMPANAPFLKPKCLRSGIDLKDHQVYGISWFQHLVSLAPQECRGALLADDMGLGKTLQLLCVLAEFYESNPDAAPSVIFAPKSLLENWKNETEKFFTPSFPAKLVLYGNELISRKQPLANVEESLRNRGIVELLRPDWARGFKIIITTYEVLTAYEFSFARQPFSFVICDEAQRIKNPAALVSKSVRTLKADFRVACTGTPVENNLADLWCLFDFVQPGLLGSLEDFGRTYRRPIECETDELRQALDRLQQTIAPQTLRRTKADIAKHLPKKFFAHQISGETLPSFKLSLDDSDRLEIPMSEHQRILYLGGLKKLRDAAQERDGRKRAHLSFGALHLMKAVCAEPYCLPAKKFLVDAAGAEQHLLNSPKMQWLLSRLMQVQSLGDKAIVFTELREAQAALYFFLKKRFGIKPHIINGDTQSRQKYIDHFSAVDGFNVIILSTLAAGAGLNVTAANHVFHFTRAWNPAKENQATDRAYRIGSTKDVYVYCPTVVTPRFKTFEVHLDEILKRKSALAGSTLDGLPLGALSQMLNGTGSDATFIELVGEDGAGQSVPNRPLTMDDVDRMDGYSFEVFCCLIWSKRGYQSSLTAKRGGDGGVDIVALKGAEGEIIQCKSSINPEVGWDAVKEVTAGAARYQARFIGTKFHKIAVTNQSFTANAVEQANVNRVELITRDQLIVFLLDFPIFNLEFEGALIDWRLHEVESA